MTARPLHRDFIADASNYGHEQNARHNNERQFCGAIGHAPCGDKAIERRNGVYENRDDHDHDQKRRAAAHVQTRETARIFGRERQTMLIAMNGFMLGAVIAEHAFDVLHATNKPNVEHENDDTHNAVDDVPKKRFVIVFAHEHIGDERRRDNEQADAQKQTKHHRDSHFALAETAIVPVAGLDRLERGRAGFDCVRLNRARLGRIGLDNDIQGALRTQGVNRFVGIAEIIFPRETAGLACNAFVERSVFFRNGPVCARFFSFRSGLFLIAIGVHRGNLERFIAQNQAFHKRAAAAHNGPIEPFVLRFAAGQIVLFNIDIARWLTHGSRPIVSAAHHNALDKRLPAHVRFVRTVFSKRALHGAAFAGSLTAFVFRGRAEHFLVDFIFFRHAFSFVRHAWSFLLD